MRKAIRNTFLVINVLGILGLLAAYLSVYISPDKFWIPAFIGLGYPFLLVFNLAFIVFWAIFRKWYALFSVIAILLGCNNFAHLFQLFGKSTKQECIKVVSYNVQHFSGDSGEDRKLNAERIVSFLDEQSADIICLQETRLRKNNIFNLAQTVNKLDNIKHYQFASSSSTYGSVTMTRFPIVNMGEIRFENTRNISIFTDVRIGSDTIRIYNIHLQSYHIDPKNYSVFENGDLREEKDREALKVVLEQMQDAWKMRAVQVKTIRRHMERSPFKVIVCGDFNDTPTSYAYHTIADELKDAFVESGHGIGRTYVGKLPSFRIDYILHSEGINSYNFETIDFKYSDHLPISCKLVVN